MAKIQNRVAISLSGETVRNGEVISTAEFSIKLTYDPKAVIEMLIEDTPEAFELGKKLGDTLFQLFTKFNAASAANDNETGNETTGKPNDSDPTSAGFRPPVAEAATADSAEDFELSDPDIDLGNVAFEHDGKVFETNPGIDDCDVTIVPDGNGGVKTAPKPE